LLSLLLLYLLGDLDNFVLALDRAQLRIELNEALAQSRLVLLIRILVEGVERVHDFLRAELSDFFATVPVKNAKQSFTLSQLHLDFESVFHGAAPPLHGAGAVG